jgi:hypothetical protein
MQKLLQAGVEKDESDKEVRLRETVANLQRMFPGLFFGIDAFAITSSLQGFVDGLSICASLHKGNMNLQYLSCWGVTLTPSLWMKKRPQLTALRSILLFDLFLDRLAES